jgi:creatinine amidohydrolase
MGEKFLARHTTASLFTLLGGKKPVIALVPIGSTEPHGPHLGLGTDVVISAAACVRACEALD